MPVRTGIYDPGLDVKVEALLRKMTLEEKVGQLVQYSAGQPTGPGTGRTDYNDMITKGQIGALFNISTAKETNAFQRIAVEKSRLHIPIVFGLDVIHGFRTEFPIPLGLASTWTRRWWRRRPASLRAKLLQPGFAGRFLPWWISPATRAGGGWRKAPAKTRSWVQRWPRLRSRISRLRLDAADSIAACAKHYVGYGAAEGGRDYNGAEISEHTLRQVYLPPFHAAVNAAPQPS